LEINMSIIDGKEINRKTGENLQRQIIERNLKPSLGILCVGTDKASLSFINVKKRFGEKYGFVVNVIFLGEQVSVEEVKQSLLKMQIENDGIILQLPLPEKFKNETEEILQIIDEKKDVDNLNGKSYFESPIILSLKKVLPPKFEKVGIVGMGKVVGQPIARFCKSKNYNFVEIGEGEFEKIKGCDVVISAIGIPHIIKSEFISEGGVLIDYGCSYLDDKLCGDFDPVCYEIAKSYIPVPGGMGPIVVACLFENTLKSLE